MPTTIELTSRAIRVCRMDSGKLTLLETYPVSAGSDPFQALASAPLPPALGKVTLLMSHGDMLLRTMVQPPSPMERLDKLVRFELSSAGEAEDISASWHLINGLGSGDFRLLTLISKNAHIAAASAAIKAHGGTLTTLTTPAIGLYHAYKALVPTDEGDAILVDVGGAAIHLALIKDGELLFVRTQTPGMDDLVKHIAEKRGLSDNDAAALVAKLGKGAPADMHDAIKRMADNVATVLNSNVRFAKAQLRIDKFEPAAVWVAGAGAQVYGFTDALKERLRTPMRILNPFAGLAHSIEAERLDRQAALPSPWGIVIGAARADEIELDALSESRKRRAHFWRTDGIVRVAAALAVVLLAAGIVRQEVQLSATNRVINILDGDEGLVGKAEKERKELNDLIEAKSRSTVRLQWLDGERRAGRIAVELLSVIAAQEDSVNLPVVLKSYKIARQPTVVIAEIEGFAEGGKKNTDAVLRQFEQKLAKAYPPISAIKQLPKPIDTSRQQFHYVITVTDQPIDITDKKSDNASGKSVLRFAIAVPAGVDADAAARVAAARERTSEETIQVKVSTLGDAKATSQDVTVSFRE